jgi:hypothetical protein
MTEVPHAASFYPSVEGRYAVTWERAKARLLGCPAGLSLAVVLAIAGSLLLWGSAYVHNTVHNQLAAQPVYFPAKAGFAHPKAGCEITRA